ncbi:MAG: AAA family ATPase [Betaproteobacteria bacterium]|nr:AAA family ATPase [Betaproteobacteria bacterium]
MPLRLKRVMQEHLITATWLAPQIKQANGKPWSSSGLAQLQNHAIWPKMSDVREIQRQIREALKARGVPDDQLGTLFELDEDLREAVADAAMRLAHSAAMRTPNAANNYEGALAARRAKADERRAQQRPEHLPDIEPIEPAMLTPAARKNFALFRDPFADDVQEAKDVYTTPDTRYVREAMWTTARLGGFLAVIGESGAGKSVLRRDLVDRVTREDAPVRIIQPQVIDKTVLTAGQICEAILDDLRPGVQVPQSLERRTRLVQKTLLESSRSGNVHVLMIEEAHDLRVGTLKYLKRFWELEDGFRKLLAIILVGQPELKAKLDERQNFEAREVIRRCEIAELAPIDDSIGEYLAHKFSRIGADASKVFDPSAYAAIRGRLTQTRTPGRTLSLCYPLVINNLVTRAMNMAADLGVPVVDEDVIRQL